MVKATGFSLIVGHLYKMEPYEILHRYVPEQKRQIILPEAHSGTMGGHYAWKATMQKILRAGICCPTLHKYVKEYC